MLSLSNTACSLTSLRRFAKRDGSENVCDYFNRLNGYARNTGLQFEGGGGAMQNDHAQCSLKTCGDRGARNTEMEILRGDSGTTRTNFATVRLSCTWRMTFPTNGNTLHPGLDRAQDRGRRRPGSPRRARRRCPSASVGQYEKSSDVMDHLKAQCQAYEALLKKNCVMTRKGRQRIKYGLQSYTAILKQTYNHCAFLPLCLQI